MSVDHDAMMAMMRCDHPDVEDFILPNPARLRMFNMSVLITDPL
jgi:ribonucleoside-diphosphate reductase alpha chain